MAKSTPLFVGLDVHKDSIAVAHAQGGRSEPPVFVGGDRDATGRSGSVDSPVAGEGVRADIRLRGGALRVRPAPVSDDQGAGLSRGCALCHNFSRVVFSRRVLVGGVRSRTQMAGSAPI